MPGPRKTSAKVHHIRGNPGKRKPPAPAPAPEPAIPNPPKHLSKVARKEWREITPHLYKLGILSQVDRSALAAYCQALARWTEAEDKLAEMGLLVKAPSGYPIQNPYLAIANKAMEQMKAFLLEFGMTPASRTRIAVDAKPADTGNPFAKIG